MSASLQAAAVHRLPLELLLAGSPAHQWPWLQQFFPRRDAPGMLRLLGYPIRAGWPAPQSIHLIADEVLRDDLRERLNRVGTQIDAGLTSDVIEQTLMSSSVRASEIRVWPIATVSDGVGQSADPAGLAALTSALAQPNLPATAEYGRDAFLPR